MRPFGILAFFASLASVAGCLNTFEPSHNVQVVNVDISPARVLAQDVVLNVSTVLDNRGGGATQPVKLQTKAYDEASGFLVAENETRVGIIPGDTTRAVSMNVKVPRASSVRVDVSVFENEQGTQRASVSARNLEALQPEILDTGLRIPSVDFIVRNVTSGTGGNGSGARVQVQADLSITNEGVAPSESLRLQVKAREVTTSLVSDVQWLDTGAIAPGATVVRSTNLTVPNGYNYVFEILTWRGDAVVARNQGNVQLAPTFVKSTNQELVTTHPNVNDFLQATPSAPTTTTGYAGGLAPPAKVPGFGFAALAGAAGLAVLTLRRRSA